MAEIVPAVDGVANHVAQLTSRLEDHACTIQHGSGHVASCPGLPQVMLTLELE